MGGDGERQMENNEKTPNAEDTQEILVGDVYTLTDDETGEESQYEIVGVADFEEQKYVAIVPANEETEEYAILRVEVEEDGERTLLSIENDDEWERVAAYFDNEIFKDIDYDTEENQ